MSELGDLLDLLYGAGERWSTARLVVRTWGDSELSGEAMRRDAAARRAQGASVMVSSRDHGGPSTWEMTTRAWVDRPHDRARTELSRDHGDSLTVRAGRLWWSYSPHSGSMLNESDPDIGGGGAISLDWMLEPSAVISALELTVTGETVVAGRPAVAVVGVPRPADPRHGVGLPLAQGADEVRLAVDRERGVLLRFESRLEARPFSVQEVVELAFEEALDDGLFRFVSPDSSPVRSPRETVSRPKAVSVEEVARRASFTVLVPTRLPRGWRVDVAYSPPAARPPRPESVTLEVRSADRLEPRVRVHQGPAPIPDSLEWEQVERGGVRILVWRHLGPGPGGTYEAKTEIAGTHVRANGDVDRDVLLDIVASLEPAPPALPPMGPTASG